MCRWVYALCGRSAGGSLSSPAALLPCTKPAACTSASLVCKSSCAAFLASAYPTLAASEAMDTAAAACAAHLAAACSSARPGLQKPLSSSRDSAQPPTVCVTACCRAHASAAEAADLAESTSDAAAHALAATSAADCEASIDTHRPGKRASQAASCGACASCADKRPKSSPV